MIGNLLQTFFQPEDEPLNTPHPGLNPWQGIAIVEEAICPGVVGRVKFRGSWWPARCDQNAVLFPGGVVQVVGIQNITLLVKSVG